MATCVICGQPAAPEAALWGNQCGDCVAAQIELMLALPRERKPVKRAPVDNAESEDALRRRWEDTKAA